MTSLVIVVSAILAFIVRRDRHTHTHTHARARADERLMPAAVVGMSNKFCTKFRKLKLSAYATVIC